jgi:multiple sugar transport system permease protein
MGTTAFQLQLLAPALVLLLAFELYPIVRGLIFALERFTIYNPAHTFVGIANFSAILTDPHFYGLVIPNTLLFMAASVGLELTIGLGLAHLLNRRMLSGRIGVAVRTVLLLPLMIPAVISGLMFAWMFNDQFGAVNYLIQAAGGPYISWFTDRWRALGVIVLAEVWMNTPYFVILLYAALRSLPPEPHEAARIDGANAWQLFRHITVPLLFPVMVVATVIRLFDAFRAFDIVWTITNGAPGGSTEVFSIYAYRLAFTDLQYDMGSAAAMVGAFVSLLVGIVFYRLFLRVSTSRFDPVTVRT